MSINEIQLQAECYQWFQNNMVKHRGKFRRVKNETDNFTSSRSRIAQGQMNKATGIVAGTWDAFFIIDPIVWIEFKWGKNTLTPEQKQFKLLGEEAGWHFWEIRSLHAFKQIANEYFK